LNFIDRERVDSQKRGALMTDQKVVPLSVVQAELSEILGRLGEGAASTAAAANPVLALEELGYPLDLEGRLELEDRGRFGARQVAERCRLREQIFEAAGRSFDLQDPQAVHRLLTDDLHLVVPVEPEELARPLVDRDPLHELKDAHPVMAPLLAYRRLDASVPGFAPRDLYARLRSGELAFPNLRLRARPRT
jgi:hypothetical protein